MSRQRAEALLRRLCEGFDPPLQPEAFEERCELGDLPVALAGWSVRDRDGLLFYGSAAAVGEDPSSRAAYELLERLSVHWAQRVCAPSRVALHTLCGQPAGWVAAKALFPEPCGGERRFRLSISNGVAAQDDAVRAREAARLELIERDRVLRSWYGGRAPRRVPMERPPFGGALKRLYALEHYEIEAPGDADRDVAVCALVGFPRESGDPLAIGFGAGRESEAALRHAEGELLQRVGFLWGEALPGGPPSLRPDPSYHLDAYLWPGAHERLRRWLRGEHAQPSARETDCEPARDGLRFADLTPASLAGELHVAKALCANKLPLAFGDYEAFVRRAGAESPAAQLPLAHFPVHPVA